MSTPQNNEAASIHSSQEPTPRSLNLVLFVTGSLWVLAAMMLSSRSAQGITDRLHLGVLDGLVEQIFFLFLLLVGFTVLQGVVRRTGDVRSTNALPRRATVRQEFQRGMALGWAMLLVAVLPMMLTGALHLQFDLHPSTLGLTALSLVTLAVGSLALEVGLHGYLFLRLIDALGPVLATVVLALMDAWIASYRPGASMTSLLVSLALTVLFAVGYLRTHALWLNWGLHFGWAVSTAILLGLPIAGDANYNQMIATTVSGPGWISGSIYGPEGAIFTLLVVLAGIAVLVRITRDYAWEYTQPVLVPGGYPVDIAPPAAHTAMEAQAKPAPLVQILGATPTAPSTMPVIEQHLRETVGTSAVSGEGTAVDAATGGGAAASSHAQGEPRVD